MKRETELSEKLCADEAVCFIADRHNVTPQQLLHYFLGGKASGEVLRPEMKAIPLEPNEIEILKGLSETVKD
jgi:hypothetical protein